MRKIRGLLLVSAMAMPMLPSSAYAQDNAPQSGAVALEDIVVTAQKREQSILIAPVAITAVSGADLERKNISGLGDLQKIDPSLKFAPNYDPSQASISLRGVGSSTVTSTIDQSVALVLDGVTIGNATALEILGDVERVEILRGPQGTLFGKNASSGVVSVTTRAPKLGEFEGHVIASYGEREDAYLNGALNVPVGDTIALRVSGGYKHLKGTITDVVTGKDIDPTNIWGVRGKLLWEPSANFSALLSVDYSKRDRWCCGATSARAADPNFPPVPGTANGDIIQYGIVPGPRNTEAAFTFLPQGSGDFLNGSLALNYDANGWKFTSITGYSRSRQNFFIDLDTVSGDFASVGSPVSKYENYSQELRVASPTGGAIDFVAGLYFYHADVTGSTDLRFGQSLIDAAVGAPPPVGLGLPPGTLPPAVFTTRRRSEIESIAAFGQANWHLTDRLNLVAGLRFTRDTGKLKEFSQTADPLAAPTGLPAPFDLFPYCALNPCAAVEPQSYKNSAFSWRIGPQYEISDDIFVYASVARGYKAPGFNAVTIYNPAGPGSFDPTANLVLKEEIPTSYEVGMKARLWNGRVQVGVDFFHTKYKNYQAAAFFTPVGAPNAQVLQSADLTTKGVEFDLQAALTRSLSVRLSGAYIDAKYDDYPGLQCYPGQTVPTACLTPGALINGAGNQLIYSPKFAYQLSANYSQPNLIGGLTGSASVSWDWRDDVPFQANGSPLATQPSYGILGGEIGISDPQAGWSLSVYAVNLLDKRFVTNINDQPRPWGENAPLQSFGPDSFRRIGAKLRFDF
ncbi:TonB-dependent receptor [Sphingobium phenoxybenzoativorans]|uniref:TonB-dependent receptor n=1 Tax=Sphingobium phenoxybenzoativorans TaxID=1592790 RepID=A0A975K9A8_9SPHN|nr:TonB-dependent receptor [Sphingobium phenoxybenzoativorans]QUT07184.1 TonB-dependent receptor [Sphingobium phenoxybenzoativorans]